VDVADAAGSRCAHHRAISATHRDIEAELRCDRRNGLTIHISRRERRDEIDGLFAQFASDAAARIKRDRPSGFDVDARAWLYHYDWPGASPSASSARPKGHVALRRTCQIGNRLISRMQESKNEIACVGVSAWDTRHHMVSCLVLFSRQSRTIGETNMRSLLAISGSMLCVLVMTACAIDDEPASRDNPAATSADPSQVVEVPPELSLDALDEAATGGEYPGDTDGDPKKCEVHWKSCQSGRPPYPEFCWTGDCYYKEAEKKAKEKCEKECPKGLCKKLEVHPCKRH
jgi:hypothetical protein